MNLKKAFKILSKQSKANAFMEAYAKEQFNLKFRDVSNHWYVGYFLTYNGIMVRYKYRDGDGDGNYGEFPINFCL